MYMHWAWNRESPIFSLILNVSFSIWTLFFFHPLGFFSFYFFLFHKHNSKEKKWPTSPLTLTLATCLEQSLDYGPLNSLPISVHYFAVHAFYPETLIQGNKLWLRANTTWTLMSYQSFYGSGIYDKNRLKPCRSALLMGVRTDLSFFS